MTLEITRNSNEPGRRLHVSDKSGKPLFDVNLDDEKQRGTLPPNVAEKVRQMESKLPGADKEGAEVEHRFEFDAGGEKSRSEEHRRDGAREGGDKKENANDNDNDKENENENENENDDEDEGRAASSTGPIRPDDLLHIAIAHVHGHGVETVKTTRVRGGRILLPYVAPIRCEGLTAGELEKQIESAYATAGVAPEVSVRVRKVTQDQREPKRPGLSLRPGEGGP